MGTLLFVLLLFLLLVLLLLLLLLLLCGGVRRCAVLYSCRNSKGQTALHLALKYGYTDVAELLLEKGIDVQAVDAEGKSSLQLCNPRVYQSQIMQLNRMGVEDRDTVLLALLKAKGDVNAAIEELTRIGAL